MQFSRALQLIRSITLTLTAAAMLLIGTGVVQSAHICLETSAVAHDHCKHHSGGSHDRDTSHHDEDSCQICVTLALGTGVLQAIDCPVSPLGIQLVVVAIDDDVIPSPSPLARISARPPPALAL